MTRKLALVTGASAGIGVAFARALAERGHDLALTARRGDRLEKLAAEMEAKYRINAAVYPADLADPAAPKALLAAIEQAGRPVDMLVNNAGYGLPGTFLNTSWEAQRDFLQVLLTAPCELAHRVLSGMADRKWGRIVNVASLAGYTPGSRGHTLYGPVKAAMIRFSESLHAETEGTGIHVTAVCPGLTHSEFHDTNGTRPQMDDLPNFMWQSAEEVVREGLEAVTRNRAVVVTGGVNKALATFAKLVPEPIGRELMKSQSKKFRRTE